MTDLLDAPTAQPDATQAPPSRVRDERVGRPVRAALLWGGGLRMAWAIVATATPVNRFSDAAQYLRVAEELASGRTPSLGGIPTAIFAPGYSAMLVPFVWVSRITGGAISIEFGASLLNVAAGTAGIWLTARVARQVGAPPAVSAWMVALCPPLVLITASAMPETVICTLSLGIVALTGVTFRATRAPATHRLVGIGLLVALMTQIRGYGLALVLVPLVASRVLSRPARLRAVGVVVLSLVLGLAPLTIRNRVEVGVWTPMSTGSAASFCMSHRDGATGLPDFSVEAIRDCWLLSPWDNRALYRPGDEHVVFPDTTSVRIPDERRWYESNTERTLRWVAANPAETARLSVIQVYAMLGFGHGAMEIAEESMPDAIDAQSTRDRLVVVCAAWGWALLCLSLLALLRLRAARRAVPVWLVPAILLLTALGGVALARYQIPLLPFTSILAAWAVAGAAAPRRVRRPLPPLPDRS